MPTPTDIEAVTELASVCAELSRLEAERARLVRAARDSGASWATIGSAMGVSRQAAWKAHADIAQMVDQVKGRSDLAGPDALALSKAALREHRAERRTVGDGQAHS